MLRSTTIAGHRSASSRVAPLVGLATLVALAAALLLPAASLASEGTTLEAAELEVVRLHNLARAQANLPPLDVHVDLHVDARGWSREMAGRQQLQHQTVTNAETPYWQTSCEAADARWTGCAENIGTGVATPRAIHDAWMASSSHRANILDPAFNRLGIGVWSDGDDLWWTARFMTGTTADTSDSTRHPQDGTYDHAPDTAYDPAGPEGTIYRLYRAYFLREPDTSGFAYWLGRYRAGQPLISIADEFSRSREFRGTYGDVGTGDFVGLVYANVLGRTPDLTGYQYWVTQLVAGMPRGAVMINFSDSVEFRSRTADGVPPGFGV